MKTSALFTYPFDQGLIDKDYLNKNTLIINAAYDSSFDIVQNAVIVQNYKYNFAGWDQKGYIILTNIPVEKQFQTVFCQIPQSKEYSLYLMAACLDALEADGVLICLAANNENGKRLKKWFETLGLNATSESKQKHRIVWAYKKDIKQNIIDEYLNKYGIQKVISNGQEFYTKPGVYGWNKIDNGSQLLANRLPNNIKGYGADYGCGYGFLANVIAKDNIQSIDCIDADYNALDCARKNLKDSSCQINYFHIDLTIDKTNKKYDWIIMNPPFHQGKTTDSDIGIKFIANAAQSLKINGMLYMVANNFLPYEKYLEKNFKNINKIVEQNGFKILFAQK